MNGRYGILGLILVIVLIFSPVSAYIELYTGDYPSYTGYETSGEFFRLYNVSAFTGEVTRMVVEGDVQFQNNSAGLSGTLNSSIWYSGSNILIGNCTINWETDAFDAWTHFRMTIDIIDMAPQLSNAEGYITLNDLEPFNRFTLYNNYTTNSTWINSNDYGFRWDQSNGNFPRQGTYTAYSGTNIDPPVPSFNATPETGFPPLTVAFNDTSTAGTLPITSWLWDFNDFSQSNHPSNASHTFNLNGTYNVTMTISDGIGSYTAFKNITVGVPPSIPGSS